MAVILVASGQGLMAVISPSTKAVTHGKLLLSNMLIKTSINITICEFEARVKGAFLNTLKLETGYLIFDGCKNYLRSGSIFDFIISLNFSGCPTAYKKPSVIRFSL